MGISLFNALSGTADSLANAAGGNQAGILQGNQLATNNMLEALQAYRQQAQDQLNRQELQSRMALQGSQKNEADARASALLAPPIKPKQSINLSPGQNAYDPDTGKMLVQGPAAREDPSVAAADRTGKNIAAQANNDRIKAANAELMAAQNARQNVLNNAPSKQHPILNMLPGDLTGMNANFQSDSTQATQRVKDAWQGAVDAGANPPDIPSLGLVKPVKAPANPYLNP